MSDRVQRLVEKARSLAPDRRDAFLDGACDGDDALRAEIDALLVATPADDTTLASSVAAGDADGATIATPRMDHEPASMTADPVGRAGPGTVIGRYKLLQQIGEGGFGAVFMAEQKEPVKRRVALKIIKLGMDTRQVIARFEAERQALAMMDHPNIARVLDAGATETGRPYFVMELVKGIPITEYCNRNSLTVRERLELMIPVCLAIQHAHQKGVIHRDLKPSNVLVTMHDGTPTPKVIDFGIAKATTSELTEKTVFTEYRQFIGTPEYMSPEQAEMSGLDIDTRSDIYSLGVLLYELVTGSTPFDPQTLRSKGIGEIQRFIAESEAPRPSTRVSMLGETIVEIARQRKVDPGHLRAMIRGELDWILLKAMEKDRTRRYETARDFADDIRRHLDDEPIRAAPPSRTYRLRKLVRRHRAAFATATLVAGALVLTTIGTSWGMVRAVRAERTAVAAADSEAKQRSIAQENERLARDAADRAEREATRAQEAERRAARRASELELMTGFQTSMLQNVDVAGMGDRMREDVLAEIRSSMARMGMDDDEVDARMAEVVDLMAWTNFTNPAIRSIEGTILSRAVTQIDERFVDEPLIRAALLQTVAETRSALGFGGGAIELMARVLELRRDALGAAHIDTVTTMGLLAMTQIAHGERTDSHAGFVAARAVGAESLGDDHPLVRLLDYMVAGGSLDPMFRDRDTELYPWWARITPGLTEADAMLAGEHIPRVFDTLAEFNIDPNSSPDGLDRDLVIAVFDRFQEVLLELQQHLGTTSPILTGFRTSIGRNARAFDFPERAEPLLREAFEAQRRMLGDAHPATVTTMLEYASTLFDLGELDRSYLLARQGLGAVRQAYGDGHQITGQVYDAIIRNLLTAGDVERGRATVREAGDAQRVAMRGSPAAFATVLALRGTMLLELGSPEAAHAAVDVLTECAELRRVHLPESWLSANAISLLGGATLQCARLDKNLDAATRSTLLEQARDLLHAGHDGLVAAAAAGTAPASHPVRLREAMTRLASLYEFLHELEPNSGHDMSATSWRERVTASSP